MYFGVVFFVLGWYTLAGIWETRLPAAHASAAVALSAAFALSAAAALAQRPLCPVYSNLTAHQLGPPQESDPEPTIYRHPSSDHIISNARKDVTIGRVD